MKMASLDFQGASPTNCTNDADCPAALCCYDASLSWTMNQSYCLCSTWYGWVLNPNDPPNCLLSGQAIASIVIFSVCGFVVLWRMFVFLYTLKESLSKGRLREDSSFGLALLFCAGWLICIVLRSIFVSLEFASPQDQTLLPFGPEWKYSSYGLYRTRPLLAASTLFGVMVDYQLILVWFAVIFLSSKSMTNRKQVLARMRYSVWIIEIAFIIGAFVLIIRDLLSNFLYFCVAFYVIALLGYAVSGGTLYVLLSSALRKQTARANAHMLQVARRIKWTAVTNGILITCNIVCALGFAITNGNFKEVGYVPAGFHAAFAILTTLQLVVVTEYFKLTLVTRLGSDKSPTTMEYTGKTIQPNQLPVERRIRSRVKAQRLPEDRPDDAPERDNNNQAPPHEGKHVLILDDVDHVSSPHHSTASWQGATTATLAVDQSPPPVIEVSSFDSSLQGPSQLLDAESGAAQSSTTEGITTLENDSNLPASFLFPSGLTRLPRIDEGTSSTVALV